MVHKDKHKHEHNQYYNVPIHFRAPWEVKPRTVRIQVNLYEFRGQYPTVKGYSPASPQDKAG